MPNLNEKKKLWTPTHPPPEGPKRKFGRAVGESESHLPAGKRASKGYKRVACLDEVGRGSLAGPVVATAVILNPKFKARNLKQIQNSKFKFPKRIWNFGHWDLFRNLDLGFRISKLRDSKQLSPKTREKFYKILTTHPGIWWGIGKVSEKVIDKINILEATKLAMERAIQKFNKKPKFLIIDGNFKLDLPIPQKSIIKADEKVFSCWAASVIAKVTRDRIMRGYHKKYPQYGFDKHKGYPTKYHLKMLKKYGPSKIHRKSFRPLKRFN